MKSTKSSFVKQQSSKMTPSQLVKKQLAGCAYDEENQKPRIIQFLNLADYSINTQSYVSIDQPLFQAIPAIIQFTDYQPLQIKEKVFKLRNKDRFSRRVKIVQPDSRLFQVLSGTKTDSLEGEGRKVAAGMDTKFVIRFSPEAKIDYRYELTVVTEREKFIVPIIAVGKRAMIDFPDTLDFGSCPVKYSTEKPVIVRNLGEKTTKWNLELPAGFSTLNKQGVLEPGKNQQILIKFYPTEAKLYKSYAKLLYDKLQAYVEIFGAGQVSNVYLSKTFIPMQQSYIGLKTQQTLQIINKSNVKVSFQWRQHMAEKQQKPIKQELRNKLVQEEQQKLLLLRQMALIDKPTSELQFADSSDEEENLNEVQMRKLKKAELAINREYKIIRKGIEDDLFLFNDRIFSIEPQEGEIWPNSQITVTVTFSPESANYYQCMAYCNISCAEQRLPLKLKGEGIGPKAYLTQQQINFGDVFVNQPIKQTVQIQNRGQIPCRFSLIKQQRAFARMFQFSVEEHSLQVGESISIDIKFKSSIPGEFKEKFRWLLQGSHKNLQMTFLGHVIAPTFEFVDPLDTNKIKNELSFGKVSYDFEYKQRIVLKNTSQVAFSFFLKIQNDNRTPQGQFRISPQTDIVPEKGEKQIQISFTPKFIKKYETVMTIDIEGVGNDMLSIPIKAECQIPTVQISPVEKLQFGEAFLNFPDTKTIVLKNVSDLKAKFHVLPQSEESKILAKYSVFPQTDVINQRDSKQIQVTLTTMKRGQITLPLHINIVGTNGNQPHILNVCATSIGPPIKIIPQQLDFGQVEVLKDYSMKVTVINTSKIPAQFHAFTKQQVSIFKPSIKHAILKPEEKLELEVICNADDSCKFSDVLHFVIKDGNDKDVVLRAKGVGSTIYCAEDLENLNFGTIYTYKTEMRQIFIQNRGRKSQKIVWQGKRIDKKKKEEDKNQEEPVFVIQPEMETIPPKYGRNFKFIAYSTKTGRISQKFQLTSQAQNQRKARVLKSMSIEGEFIQPSLVYSEKKMNFKYLWEKDVPFSLISKVLEITSNSTLALNFALRVSPPFYVDQQNITLQQGKSAKVKVDFDPSYKVDRVSSIVNGRISIIHLNHPHKQYVDLIGEVCFPNIKLDTNMINFGAILNDTTKKVTILMRNVSEMALDYQWTFIDEDIMAEDQKMNSSNSFGNQSVPINQIFDILPLSGKLEPNCVEEVEFVYNALGGQNFRATALCHVEGGPNYQMKLEGDSSLISGRVSEKELDFGEQRFCEWSTKEIVLQNTGKVTFEYKVSLQNVRKKGIVEVTPMQGIIPGNHKQKVLIKVCPITPEPFEQTFTIQMGYFQPETISIRGTGVIPSILSNIPRISNQDIDLKIKQQTEKYEAHYKKLAKDKAKKKELKSVEQHRNDFQKQIDRQQFCKTIDDIVQTGKVIPAINLSEAKFYDKLYVTSWNCDFENIIIGTTQKKTFKIKNNGSLPLDMYFDTKNSKLMNYTISPESITKMAPGDEVQVTITLATKKNMKYGKSKVLVPIEIKNGPQYSLDLLCNITIPELIIEGVNDNLINFGKVLCGQRKIIYVRLLNKKQIPCEWFLNLRENNLGDKKEELKFSMSPANGKIAPNGFQLVELSFYPGQQKQYHNKFPLRIIDNSKPLTIDLRGIGTSIGLDIVPNKVKIGPVLPYDNFSYQTIQIINPTDYPTEVISLDFDKNYYQEQTAISIYQQIENSSIERDKDNKDIPVYLPVRQPGSGLWPDVIKSVQDYKKKIDLDKKLRDENVSVEQKQKIQQQIQTLSSKQEVIVYPKKVEPQLLHHVVIIGLPKSGKTTIAKTIKKEQSRAIVNLNELLDWNINYNTETANEAKLFLEQRRKQYEAAVQQRQKLFKKLGKKAQETEQRIGPANEHLYQILPEDILVNLLKERMKHPQCAAGCIFDGLKSKNISNSMVALKVIMRAAGNQSVQLLVLDKKVPNKEQKKQEKTENKLDKSEDKSIKQPSKEQSRAASKLDIKSKDLKDTKKLIPKTKKKIQSIPSLDVSAIEQKKQDEVINFDVAEWEPQVKQQFQNLRNQLVAFIQNQHSQDPSVTLFKDPIYDELKKDEKPKPPVKGSEANLEQKPNTSDPQANKDNSLFDGNRVKTEMPIYQNSLDQKKVLLQIVPQPVYGDPLNDPVPTPIYQQIITRHVVKPFQSKVSKQFTLLTPKNSIKQFKIKPLISKRQTRREQKKQKEKQKQKQKEKQQIKQQKAEVEEDSKYKLQDLIQNQTRWIVPANSSLTLIVRFFSKVTGSFESNFTFQNPFGLRKLSFNVVAKSEFPQLVNIPKNIFNSIKKSRPPTLPDSLIYKSYVQSENVYDFGPLLIGKSSANRQDKPVMVINSTIFKMVNQGPFPTNIEFALKSAIMENNPEYKKDIFQLSHDKLVLNQAQQTQDIRVWALPDTPQKFKDELIVMIKDNPSPIVIPLQCTGCKPQIDIVEGNPVKFTRILLKQVAKKEIKLKNNGFIPIRFKLKDTQTLPEQFSINIKQGQLKPTEQITIQIIFKAIKQQKFNHKLILQAEDLEEGNIKSEPKDILIEAEAFDITVDLKFTDNNNENLLDFGSMRVGDYKDQTFTVKNIGLYNVKFCFVMKKKMFKQAFKIEPTQVQLQPNGSKQILVRCSTNKELKLRTNNNTTDLMMEIQEGKTLETNKVVPINIAVNAVFSKYSMVPLKSINFGPIQFNQSKTRTFQIKNEGLFEFSYSLFDFNNQQFRRQLQSAAEKERQSKLEAAGSLGSGDPKKGAAGKKQTKQVKKQVPKKGKGKGDIDNQLKIGQWTITPCQGSIPPQGNAVIEVVFTGAGQKLYQQKLGLDIQNRDPNDQPKGILYQLVAQSCIPGINSEDFQSIFQQQVVMPSQNSGSNISDMISSNVFFVEEKIFYFGTLVPSKHPDGVVQKLKIQNSNKVPCNIKLDVRKKNPNSVQQFAFELNTKQIKIPAHDHCYVNIIFKPTIMATYSGVFEAIVENGEQNPKTHKLVFDLRGEGVLPTVKVEKPRQFLDERTILLKFPKTRLGKTSSLPIVLKNDGVIQANVKWQLPANQCFKMDMNSYALTPKTYATFNVEFKPTEIGVKSWEINVQTLLNQYQNSRFKVQGEGFLEQILFENLPQDLEERCSFKNSIIGKQKSINFLLRNNGPNTLKFNWKSIQDFTFVPKTGHIEKKGAIPITLTFNASKTINHKDLALGCETIQVKQNSPNFIQWNDALYVTRFVTKTEADWINKKREQQKKRKEEEAIEQAKNAGKKQVDKKAKAPAVVEQKKQQAPIPDPSEQATIQIKDPIPQPEFTPIDKTDKTINLITDATADYAKYQVSNKLIKFLPTLMYTSRMHKVSLKNTSLIELKYSCKVVSAETGKIDPGYYLVSPHNGVIQPGCDETFVVRFSPTEVEDTNERLLVVNIENLDPTKEKLIIELDGETQRPICHFQLQPSTYREKKPDIEAKWNIIQFESLGTKVKNIKRFYVVNPTSVAYEFEWKKIDDQKATNSAFFRCQTPKGTILSGKKSQMVFEYSPDFVGTHQSYWMFEIPSQNIIQYFMIVGVVVEPNVFFDMGKINFGPLLIGGKIKETIKLKNLEDVPIPFNFDRQSIKGQLDYGESLKVEPISGTIPSQGDIPIEITFLPRLQKQFNYNLCCTIKRKSRPICINVKGIGYVLSHSVTLGASKPLQPSERNQVSFGSIFVNEKKGKILTIENNGDFNFDFAIKKFSCGAFLIFSSQFGTVKKGEKLQVNIEFTPTQQFTFSSNAYFTLSIISGPSYNFAIRGSSKKPGVQFSFYNYDFGPCFVLRNPLPVTAYLEIRNRESTSMSIEPLFEKSTYFDVRLASGQVVIPLKYQNQKDKRGINQQIEHNVLRVPIVFTPRQLIKYNETFMFNINNLHKVSVQIKGEGIPFKLQVQSTEDQNIDLGIMKVGEQIHRVIPIVNTSRKKIEITFDVDNQIKQLKKMCLDVSPLSDISINPRERKNIEISYYPTSRMHVFKTDLNYKILDNQEKRKLLSLQSAAYGIQLKLMEQTIGFGTVVVNSKLTKTVQLANLGDVGAKFSWDTTFCQKYFTISPKKGYLPPHQDLIFEITFHPNVIDPDIRFKIKCSIEDSDSLFMSLLGKCIDQPKENIQTIKFDTVVRTSKTQKVQVKNPTAKAWKVKALISSSSDNNYFSGKEYIEVPANGAADYEVIYTPLTMTSSPDNPHIRQQSHEGELFFPLADGSAILYKLSGKSLPSQPLQTLDFLLKAKKSGFLLIPIKNWLKTAQRFDVTWKFEAEDKSIFINTANTFDIAGDSTKEYKLSAYALKATQAKFDVFFTNPNTHEYIHYKVNLTVQPPDLMPKIQLTSLVRQVTSKLITIQNPLLQQVEIKKQMIIVDNDNLFVQPSSFVIPAKSQFGFQIVFRPLLAKQDSNSKITIKSPELGEFAYPLKLVGNPSTLQRSLAFKANLGSDISQTFKFNHFGKKATTYNCRVEKIGQKQPVNPDPKAKQPVATTDFIVETPTIQAPASTTFDGIQLGVNIKFEPSSLFQSQCQLIVSSADSGQYLCTLIGLGIAPQPKGPFKIGAKSPPIDFKNPFFDATEFIIRIDNPCFVSGTKSPVKLDSKKGLAINLSYKATPGFSNSGRMIISAGDNPPWVFYLLGE